MQKEKPKILVVDDEPEVVDSLKTFFSNKGYDVIGAFSGEEALNILEKGQTDLILLDMMMPGIKGKEVAKLIKEKYPSMKLIVVTGHPDQGNELANENMLDGLFIKPLEMKELDNKLLSIFKQTGPADAEITSKQGIKARVLLIKAKLLFIEPSGEIFSFLGSYFKGLSEKGENYDLESAGNAEDAVKKAASFAPDLLAVNYSFLNKVDKDFLEKIYNLPSKPKETIIYRLADAHVTDLSEIERLTRAIQLYCLKNGLIEVKWAAI